MAEIAAIGALVGAGVSAYSAVKQSNVAKDNANLQNQEIADQQKQEALRQQATELDAQRKQTEILRNQQRARSLAISSAVNQGANTGSGLQGGLAQISGNANWQGLGIDQQSQFGTANFGINNDISNLRMSMANNSATMASYAALGSLGGTLVQASGTIGKLSGSIPGLFGNNQSQSNWGFSGGGYYGTDGARYPGPGRQS